LGLLSSAEVSVAAVTGAVVAGTSTTTVFAGGDRQPADVVVTGVMFPDLPDATRDAAGADPAAVAAPPDEGKLPE